MAQAKAVAQAIAGQPVPYAEVPWFWSDQYDLKLQIAGVGDPDDELVLRGEMGARSFSVLHLRERRLVAIDCINRGGDFLAAKRLIAAGTMPERARLADPDLPLGDPTASSPGRGSLIAGSGVPTISSKSAVDIMPMVRSARRS